MVDYPPARTGSRGLLKIVLIGKVYERKSLLGSVPAFEEGKAGWGEWENRRTAVVFPLPPLPNFPCSYTKPIQPEKFAKV